MGNGKRVQLSHLYHHGKPSLTFEIGSSTIYSKDNFQSLNKVFYFAELSNGKLTTQPHAM